MKSDGKCLILYAMKNIRHILFLIFLLLVSCGRLDFSQLETGEAYAGQWGDRNCVVVLDQLSEGRAEGRVYLDEDSPLAAPLPFTAKVGHKGKGHVQIGEKQEKLQLTEAGRSLKGSVQDAKLDLTLQPREDLPFRAMYKEPFYEVKEEDGIVYAGGVPGYWASFPDLGKDFGSIYAERASWLAKSKDLDLDMDLYLPVTPDSLRRPLVLLIHGGAFYNGDKQALGFPEMGRHFAERGFVVASINYRLGFWPFSQSVDRAGYRSLQDANAAVRFLVGRADEYGIDTDNIFALGTSAGGITALNLAFMQEEDRPDASRKVAGDGLRRFAHKVRNLAHRVSGKPAEEEDPSKEGESDLGAIDSINPEMDYPFHIKGVVNMWGALHNVTMLKHSPQTAILSIHGDKDKIVPYAYDYPFRGTLEGFREQILGSIGVDVIRAFVEKLLSGGKPLHEVMFRPMYGSKAIDDAAKALGMRSDLITRVDGDHALHIAPDRLSLAPYFFDTIIPQTTLFLGREMAGGVQVSLQEADGGWFEAVGTKNVEELHWQVEGGAIVRSKGNQVEVLYFADAPRHAVTVCGTYKNGMEFRETESLEASF